MLHACLLGRFESRSLYCWYLTWNALHCSGAWRATICVNKSFFRLYCTHPLFESKHLPVVQWCLAGDDGHLLAGAPSDFQWSVIASTSDNFKAP